MGVVPKDLEADREESWSQAGGSEASQAAVEEAEQGPRSRGQEWVAVDEAETKSWSSGAAVARRCQDCEEITLP